MAVMMKVSGAAVGTVIDVYDGTGEPPDLNCCRTLSGGQNAHWQPFAVKAMWPYCRVLVCIVVY